jgi:hypothetical protein
LARARHLAHDALTDPHLGVRRRREVLFETESDQEVGDLALGGDSRHDLLTRVTALGERHGTLQQPCFGGEHVLSELRTEARDARFDAQDLQCLGTGFDERVATGAAQRLGDRVSGLRRCEDLEAGLS